MSFSEEINNPLGFTKQVSVLLTGLGCSNLTKFKLRNICLDDLKYLTEQDLIVLDVGDNFKHKEFKKLCYNLRKKCNKYVKETTTSRVCDIIKILDSGQKQLQVLNIYLNYLNKKLQNTSFIDFFIDKNKNLKISEVLEKASQSVLDEINNLEVAINSIQLNEPEYHKNNNNKIKYSILIGGLGILGIIYIFY